MSNEQIQQQATKETAALLKAMRDLPPPKEVPLDVSASTQRTHTYCVCDKKKPITEMESIETCGFHVVNNVCRECRDGKIQDRQLSRVACKTCKQVVARLTPGPDTDGFVFQPNATYHVETCGVCNPGSTESVIIEKYLYQQIKRNNP